MEVLEKFKNKDEKNRIEGQFL